MNRKGFTLVELLGSVAVLAIVLVIGLCATKDTLATSLIGINKITDEQVYRAASNYVIDKNISFNGKTSVCVSVKELMDYGYLKSDLDDDIKDKIVLVERDNSTKVINEIKYVDKCN